MSNDEARGNGECLMTNDETCGVIRRRFSLLSSFDIRHSSFPQPFLPVQVPVQLAVRYGREREVCHDPGDRRRETAVAR